ncbi:MAG: AEC family transporter [Pasteurellaceae bacterium]|nr:AEC family transporter [Pasteurellaceae bacterium]
MFLDSLLFSLNVTLPTILMLVLGIILRRQKMIDDHFCQTASKLVFNIALPALLFVNIVKNPVDYGSQLWLISAGVIASLVLFFASEWIAARYIAERKLRGIFVQGVFRGNSGLLGLALCINAYGATAAAPASVYAAGITFLFNVLAVITLTNSLSDNKLNIRNILRALVRNPLILSILAGILVSQYGWQLPQAMLRTGDYLASIALPVALICAGASLDFKQLKRFQQQESAGQVQRVVWWASIGRLLISPVVAILIGKSLFQLEPMSLGILFLMSSTPTAAASYAMVRHFAGDATTAANIIAMTSLGSMFTSSIGLFILKQLAWI